MDAEGPPLLIALEELVPLASRPAEVHSEFLGARRAGERRSRLAALGRVYEPARLRRRLRVEMLLPDPQRFRDRGIERPTPRVVGLVAIEVDHPVLQVEVDEVERERLLDPEALAVEH